MKDDGIENQKLIQKLNRVQLDCGIWKKYRNIDLKLVLHKERSIREIKRNIIYMMHEFSQMAVASIAMSEEDSDENEALENFS